MQQLKKKHLILLGVVAFGVVVAYFVGVGQVARGHLAAAEEALEHRDFGEAEIHLNRYLEMRPDDLYARLLAARTARRQHKLEAAAAHLETYRKSFGSKANLEQRLLRLQGGDLEEVPELLAECAENPDGADTPFILEAILEGTVKVLIVASETAPLEEAALAAEIARVKQALGLWNRLRSGPLDRAQGLIWQARLHQAAHKYDDAIVDLRKAVEIAPEFAEARYLLAVFLVLASPEEAAQHLEALLHRHPGNRSILFSLAETHRQLGHFERAAEILDQLLVDSPDNTKLLLERGNVSLNNNQVADAERWLRRALAVSPKDPQVNMALSGCLRRAGRDAEAKVFHDVAVKERYDRQREQAKITEPQRAAKKKH